MSETTEAGTPAGSATPGLGGRGSPSENAGPASLGRPFRLLWLGQSASLIGDQITLVALPLVAVTYTGATTFQVGVLSTVLKLPFLLIGLQAGVWVSRWGLGRSMLVADIVRGTVLGLATTLLLLAGSVPFVVLGAAVAVIGSATVFFQVAYQSFVPDVVADPEGWHGANLRLSLSESVSLLAGPAIGGIVISAVSLLGALVLDVTSYVISVLTLVALLAVLRRTAGTTEPRQPPEHVSMIAAVTAGLRYVRAQPVLNGIMWTGALYNIGSAMFESMLILYGVRSLDLSPGQVGVAIGVGAAGYPLGGLLSGRANRRHGRGMVMWLAAFPSVVGIAVVGAAAGPPAIGVLCLGVFVVGVGQGAFAVNAVTLRQLHSSPEMRARATSVHRFTSWGALPVGTMLAGIIGQTLGLRAVMLLAALLAGLCFVPLSARAMRCAP